MRAYVGGKGLWSTAEKDAAYHFEAYGCTSDPKEYEAYQAFLRVSLDVEALIRSADTTMYGAKGTRAEYRSILRRRGI